MSKSVIHTDKAPQAIGTYSQAIKSGTTVSVSYTHLTLPTNREV